jgi:signal transduction histidine kinase/PAS domain-containing protein
MTGPTVHGQVLAGLEIRPGNAVNTAADRLAALTARACAAPSAMIHLVEDRQLRLIGGHRLPEGFTRADKVPASATLAGLVVHYGFAVVIEDVRTDARVPPDAPVRAAGVRSYAGFPIHDPAGAAVGVCAVMDHQPRRWQAAELAAVDEGAQACSAFVADQHAVQQIERQRCFLNTLLDSLDTGVIACDADGHLVAVNQTLRQSLDIAPVRTLPQRWVPQLPLTRPDGTPVTVHDVPLLRALTTGEHVHGVEQVAEIHRGERRLYSVNAHPIIGADGQRQGAVSVFHDITHRRRAERFRGCELAVTRMLTEARDVATAAPPVLEAIADTLGWPFAELWLVDPTGQTLRRIGCHHTGHAPAELPTPPALTPGQGLAGAVWQRAEPRWHTDLDRPGGAAIGGVRADGRWRTAVGLPVTSAGRVQAVLTLYTDGSADPHDDLVALLSGTTAQIGQFLERRRAEQLQHALSTSKDQYLNLVGHELRSPITVVSAYLDLLDELDPDTTLADARPMTDAMRRASNRLRRLVEALLDLSALDSGLATIGREPVDLAAVAAAAAQQARATADGKGVTITTDLPPWLPVTGDERRLTQLVTILLDNAVTYTPPGGAVRVHLTSSADSADLTVADDGPGIPEDERPHIFDRFFRGRITTEQSLPGAGLGLALAQLITDRHHGTIELRPTHPGTTVHLRLPATRGRPGDREP